MAKDPAFLFYSQDFIVGTNTMNFEDRGKYITILAQMHQQGRLDEETISFLVGSISVKLKNKFLIADNGLWYNERLEEEAIKRSAFIDSRRENGKKGGRPSKASGKASGKAKHKLPVNENENENKDKNIIPTEAEFIDFALSKKSTLDKHVVKLKYESWVLNGWKDGNGNKVINWKSKLLNTIPHLTEAKATKEFRPYDR